jgi:hypothetical protein
VQASRLTHYDDIESHSYDLSYGFILGKSLKICVVGVFLDDFAKLRRATISFVMFLSVRPSARMGQLGSHWVDFYDI